MSLWSVCFWEIVGGCYLRLHIYKAFLSKQIFTNRRSYAPRGTTHLYGSLLGNTWCIVQFRYSSVFSYLSVVSVVMNHDGGYTVVFGTEASKEVDF